MKVSTKAPQERQNCHARFRGRMVQESLQSGRLYSSPKMGATDVTVGVTVAPRLHSCSAVVTVATLQHSVQSPTFGRALLISALPVLVPVAHTSLKHSSGSHAVTHGSL